MSRRNENASGTLPGIPKEKFTTCGEDGMASRLQYQPGRTIYKEVQYESINPVEAHARAGHHPTAHG